MSNLKTLVLMSLVAGLTAPVLAYTEKPAYDGPVNVPMPFLQGGDAIGNALAISSLPFTDVGTTAGFVNDYDEACPYTGSTSPDVVFSYTPATNQEISIDLFGSAYDTKVYVYDNAVTPGAPYACNDDYYSDYTSFIGCLPVVAEHTYFIVVDGYGGAFGEYNLNVTECAPPPVCEGWEVTLELHDSWGDGWNGAALYIGDTGYTFTSGNEATGVICLDPCTEYAVSCTNGSYPSEVSWDIYDGETLLLSGIPGTTGTLYFCPAVDANELPMAYSLKQNVPNPFNPTTTISFSMAETGAASLKVFDLAGREVATLVDGNVERGEHSVSFDASNLSSGVYFYTLQAGATIETKKMVLMK